MKKLILVLTLAAASAFSQPVKLQKEVWCEKPDTVMAALTQGDFREVSTWIGQEGETNVTLLHNPATKTWTVVQFNQSMACVLASGKNSNLLKTDGNGLPNLKGNL